MRRAVSCLIILIQLFASGLYGQENELRLRLLNKLDSTPVSDAHVFLSNTSYGAISDRYGNIELLLPDGVKEDMIVSHISYEVELLPYVEYIKLDNEGIVALNPAKSELDALVISGKRTRRWKKQFKLFQKVFLGSDKAAQSCRIVNPEVLRFEEEEDGNFKASATDLIQIENPYLGYDVLYLLNSLEVKSNGSSEYLGRAQFTDRSEHYGVEVIKENRRKAYLQSAKHFYKALIQDSLEEAGFKVSMTNYSNGQFLFMKDFDRHASLTGPDKQGQFRLSFDEFLEVYNQSSRSLIYENTGVRPGGLESQRFSGSQREEKAVEHFDKSYLYKLSPYLLLDKNGNVLNSRFVKEYGFWAQQKFAYQLPFDYVPGSLSDSELSHQEYRGEININSGLQDANALFREILYESESRKRNQALDLLDKSWQDSYAAPLIEIMRFEQDTLFLGSIKTILNKKYGESLKGGYFDWIQWLWKQNFEEVDTYFDFKSELYGNIDPKFYNYFRNRREQAIISLDEVVWGGVKQDGIPPLRSPKMINASEADYLDDSDIVFGVFLNGVARAYPKRILAWHEFFTDSYDGMPVAGVYCTLCGTVIIYDCKQDGVVHELGTSGFLYRSNKLMFDKATQSLWSTVWGRPVLGPLVGQNIRLKVYPVVTTSWKEWLERHPDTRVLSIHTGYERDYSEGVAYRDYFSHDRLMFPVVYSDNSLNNKDEIIIARVEGFESDPLAISVDYLRKKKWHQDSISGKNIMYLADKEGGVRVFETGDQDFSKFRDDILIDSKGREWQVSEEFIAGPLGEKLLRTPSHSIFWFGWHNLFPDSRLVK